MVLSPRATKLDRALFSFEESVLIVLAFKLDRNIEKWAQISSSMDIVARRAQTFTAFPLPNAKFIREKVELTAGQVEVTKEKAFVHSLSLSLLHRFPRHLLNLRTSDMERNFKTRRLKREKLVVINIVTAVEGTQHRL